MTVPSPDELESPRRLRAVPWLIALNVAVYFLQFNMVDAQSVERTLGFTAQSLSDARNWLTVLTSMFVHGGVWHLALNMYALALFGPRLERAWTPGEFARFYLLCGLGGWLVHLVLQPQVLLIGSTAAVLGVMLAYALRWPDEEVYLLGLVPAKTKWLMPAFVALLLISGIAGGDLGGGASYFTHAGGLAAGWLLLRSSAASSINRLRQHVSQLPDEPDETPRAIPRTPPRARERGGEVDDIVARSNAALGQRVARTQPAVEKPPPHLTDLNLVLDKISRQGMSSLTAEELKLLEEMSRDLRRRG